MKKQYWIILGIIWHIFIFLQSALPGEQSASQSGLIVDYIYPFIHHMGITLSLNQVSFLIRILAHFTEYFVLGVIFYHVYIKYVSFKKLGVIVITHGFITAVLDETLQTFIPNRSGQFTDVLIDTLGVITAFLLITLGRKLYERQRTKKSLSR